MRAPFASGFHRGVRSPSRYGRNTSPLAPGGEAEICEAAVKRQTGAEVDRNDLSARLSLENKLLREQVETLKAERSQWDVTRQHELEEAENQLAQGQAETQKFVEQLVVERRSCEKKSIRAPAADCPAASSHGRFGKETADIAAARRACGSMPCGASAAWRSCSKCTGRLWKPG